MSRYIQQPKDNKKVKPKERKIPLSQPGSKGYNQTVMVNSKPLYTNQGKV